MNINKEYLDEILKIYNEIKPDIIKRLDYFKENFKKGSEEDILAELIFCVFTPQSKAKKCWEAVCDLKEKNLICNGDDSQILECINNVRFKYRKSKFACLARDTFTDKEGNIFIKKYIESFEDILELRESLVTKIKGYGWKEGSHFLRNIGKGDNLAILDRHILKNIVKLNIIKELPKTITKKRYLEIEELMRVFSKDYNIPMDHLDFLLWYKEAGEIFK